MFSDLECDYINPIDLCSQLNRVRVLRPSLAMRNIRVNVHVSFSSLSYPNTERMPSLLRVSCSRVNGWHSR
jgi:hypothetical protein